MFGRRKTDDAADKPAVEKRPEMILPIPIKPKIQPGGQVSPAAKAPLTHPESQRRPADASTVPVMPALRRRDASDNDGKMLIVGREIALSGEINACDKLVVEGKVEAN